MESLRELRSRMQDRVVDLWRMKQAGVKVVGHFAGDFVPEELIHAAGAVPVGLVHGKSPEPFEAAHFAAIRILCP